jgi:hypothetical protein
MTFLERSIDEDFPRWIHLDWMGQLIILDDGEAHLFASSLARELNSPKEGKRVSPFFHSC